MTNVTQNNAKKLIRRQLFSAGIEALKKQGWKVERLPKEKKSSLRRITKNGESKTATIRTSQDRYVAFPRTNDLSDWVTLPLADLVVVVSVDDRYDPTKASVHIIDGDEMRDRFNRAYQARIEAGYKIPPRRGVWLSMYDRESDDTVNLIGAGAGLDNPSVLTVPIQPTENTVNEGSFEPDEDYPADIAEHLTIDEAKRRLALTFGVDPSAVRISVEA